MTPTLSITIKANPDLHSSHAVYQYVDELIANHPDLEGCRYALSEIVNTQKDDPIELYHEDGITLIWMPEINRAALMTNGDWLWTDASSPAEALERYQNDDMRP